jgi:O-antigen/teichoic acid export membrane protein
MAALVAVATAIAVGALTPVAIVTLFGSDFRAAVPAALVLVAAALVLGFNFVAAEGLRGIGRPVAALVAELVGVLITVGGLVVMLKPLGIVGAAIASLLGYGAVGAVLTLMAARAIDCSVVELIVPTRMEFAELLTFVRTELVDRRGRKDRKT